MSRMSRPVRRCTDRVLDIPLVSTLLASEPFDDGPLVVRLLLIAPVLVRQPMHDTVL
jgi:hypothetical protein